MKKKRKKISVEIFHSNNKFYFSFSISPVCLCVLCAARLWLHVAASSEISSRLFQSSIGFFSLSLLHSLLLNAATDIYCVLPFTGNGRVNSVNRLLSSSSFPLNLGFCDFSWKSTMKNVCRFSDVWRSRTAAKDLPHQLVCL